MCSWRTRWSASAGHGGGRWTRVLTAPRLRYGPVIHTIAELLEQVAAGQGVAISSALLQDAYLRHDVAFVPVTDVEPSEVMLCTRPEDRSPRVELLRKLIEKLPDQVR